MDTSDWTDLVMLDTDHEHGERTVFQLVCDRARHPDKLVIVGLNFRRCKPFDPCIWFERPDGSHEPPATWGKGLIGPLHHTGLAQVIIAREVFERIKTPWFAFGYDKWPDPYGEDQWFCDRLREAGIEIWCDTTVTGPHEPNLDHWVDESWWERTLVEAIRHADADDNEDPPHAPAIDI